MAACPADPLYHQPLQIPPPVQTTIEHHLLLSHPVPHSLSIQPKLRSASQSHPSQMAVLSLGCGVDKENAAPPSAARGIAVKRRTMKKPGAGSKAPRRGLPLRDITCLFVNAAPCPPPSTAVLLALSDATLPEAVPVRPALALVPRTGVTVKQGSHSLRMGFR